ncbi:MAG: Flp pilus assembly complex ATPase component TadA [Deltaproteobacteria bacterium]|nr:Flp pilus assembly complex ATPase component TadA [Deltaproteobacteria bacterium]
MSTPTENTPKAPLKRKKLGELLFQANLIDQKTLENALEIQKTQKKKIGQILVDLGVTDDEKIAKALASQLKIPFLRLNAVQIPKEVIDLVPQDMAENYLLLPVKVIKKQLVIAMANPLEFYALDDLRFITQMSIFVTVAPQSDILSAIQKFYPIQSLNRQLGPDMGFSENIEIVGQAKEKEHNLQDLLNLTELPPVVRFTNTVLADAIKMKASDVHIEPQKDNVVIRYRIDGIMREIMQIDKQIHLSLVSRIKIISNMDISIRRKPQDGRAQVKMGGSRFDLRISTLPASYGEKVTIRILNPNAGGMAIEELGFSEKDLRHFIESIDRPQGIILVTGPTGSGKSSTLYTALKRLNSSKVNIVTVEDPVEFDIAGINQVQINPKAGVTFADGLRSILRQDPDIVMVGEIRDAETAKIAFQAAQTGHLVLSTLHTNDAASAVTRLLDMGVDSFVIADSLIAVIGQRLVRGICKKCKIPDPLTPQIFEQLESVIKPDRTKKFWKGAGCEACQYSGYTGRIGIFEVLMITPAIKEILSSNVAAVTIKKAAEKDGFTTLSMDGITKAFSSLTTIEEVFRVAPPEYDDTAQETLDRAMESREPVSDSIEREAHKPEPPSSIGSIRPEKILIVDDNPVILQILKNILESQNYQTVSANNGIDALKIAVQQKPNLIITDYMMPEMDGMALINKLKSQLTTRFIPVVMLTAKDEVDAEVDVINAGADDYLTKPVNPKRLIVRINRLLNRPSVETEC